MAGIKSGKAGFDSIIIEPHNAGSIKWMEAEYNSSNGKIVSKWTNTGVVTKYDIKTPAPAKIIINGKEHDVEADAYEFSI